MRSPHISEVLKQNQNHDQSTFRDSAAAKADDTMLLVYIGGVAYTFAEYLAYLKQIQGLEHLGRLGTSGFTAITPIFAPVWNFIDAIGVLFDAAKDYQNKDNISASINVFSSLQLMSGTILGQIGNRSELLAETVLSPLVTSTLSAGSFALCMFCSAAVAGYKYQSLEQDIQDLDNNRNTPDIVNRLKLRHPNYKLDLTQANTDNRGLIRSVLKAEQEYQKAAFATWMVCGIAMTIVAVSIPCAGIPALMIAAMASVVISGAGRAHLKQQEKVLSKKVDEIFNPQSKENVKLQNVLSWAAFTRQALSRLTSNSPVLSQGPGCSSPSSQTR